ncbi:hypothetical protein DVH24_022422 [Malus domestica]|uniref:Uncharacterized protein n=1 Tax=Malus domestica TaxID=3750 RepID=A0A498KKM5_MALDO|nr:hypothetical protein DVH24_022422 [Malus domestica]
MYTCHHSFPNPATTIHFIISWSHRVVDRLSHWELVLLIVTNYLFFFIREKNGEKEREKDRRV